MTNRDITWAQKACVMGCEQHNYVFVTIFDDNFVVIVYAETWWIIFFVCSLVGNLSLDYQVMKSCCR